jgi:hypothetical protein
MFELLEVKFLDHAQIASRVITKGRALGTRVVASFVYQITVNKFNSLQTTTQ